MERVRVASPAVQPTRAPFEPVVGVLFSALVVAGMQIDARLCEQITRQINQQAVFGEVQPTA